MNRIKNYPERGLGKLRYLSREEIAYFKCKLTTEERANFLKEIEYSGELEQIELECLIYYHREIIASEDVDQKPVSNRFLVFMIASMFAYIFSMYLARFGYVETLTHIALLLLSVIALTILVIIYSSVEARKKNQRTFTLDDDFLPVFKENESK